MKHTKIITYVLVMPIMAILVSCLPESSQVLSYTGAWGTVEPDSKTGDIYVRPDVAGVLTSNDNFREARSGNRVVFDFTLDASKFKVLLSGEYCYNITVSKYEEIALENSVAMADTANINIYGTHPFDDVSVYPAIVTNCNKRQTLSMSVQYSGDSDTYPMTMIQRFPVKRDITTENDTVKFEMRCDNKGLTGTRPYLRYKAYDITPYLGGLEKAVVQVSYTIKLTSGTQVYKTHLNWVKPKEE